MRSILFAAALCAAIPAYANEAEDYQTEVETWREIQSTDDWLQQQQTNDQLNRIEQQLRQLNNSRSK